MESSVQHRSNHSLTAVTASVRAAWITAAGVVVLAVGFAAVPPASANRLVETFDTTTYEDAATTASWGEGVLTLEPYSPSIVASHPLASVARGITIVGGRAYVGNWTSGLRILDVSDPSAPTLLGTFDTPGAAWGIDVSWPLAFVADQMAGLMIVDVTDPAAPVLLGSYDTPGIAFDVAVEGDRAFVADGTQGLAVIDVSDPTTPVLAGSYVPAGVVRDVFVAGNYAFLANDFLNGLRIVDITDPTTPVPVSQVLSGGNANGVHVHGGIAYVADAGQGLLLIDVRDPSTPLPLGSASTPGSARAVVADGHYAYVADDAAGLSVFDISDKSTPVYLTSVDTPGVALAIASAGEHVLIADNAAGVHVVDVAASMSVPAFGGGTSLPGILTSISVEGDYAYTGTPTGLRILDVHHALDMTEVSFRETAGPVGVVDLEGSLAYVGTTTGRRLEVLDVSDPSAPAGVGSYLLADILRDVHVDGDVAYVAASFQGLRILDVSNPATITEIGVADCSFASTVDVAGDRAYTGAGDVLCVTDVTDPAAPEALGTFEAPSFINDVAALGQHVLLVLGTELCVVDVADPSQPFLVATAPIPYQGQRISVSGSRAYVAARGSGWVAFDIADPTNPVQVTGFGAVERTADIDVQSDLVFFVDEQSGGINAMKVFDRAIDVENSFAQSLTIGSPTTAITAVLLDVNLLGAFTFEVTADGGASWQVVSPGILTDIDVPGTDLRWRCNANPSGMVDVPSCSDVTLSWLPAEPADLVDWNAATTWDPSNAPFDTATISSGGQLFRNFAGTGIDALVTGAGNSHGSPRLLAGDGTGVHLEDDQASADPSLTITFLSGRATLVLEETQNLQLDERQTISVPDSHGMFPRQLTNNGGALMSVDGSPVPGLGTYVSTGSTTVLEEAEAGAGTGFDVTLCAVSGFTWAFESGLPAGSASVLRIRIPLASVGVAVEPAPPAGALLANSPNPFNPATSIRYRVPVAGHVQLSIFDVRGALVRTLVAGYRPAGPATVAWDGRLARGTPAASGVYVYRLRAPGVAETRTMVLSR